MHEQRERGGDRRIGVVINRSAGDGDVGAARAAFEPLRAAGRVSIRETDSAGVVPAIRTARAMGAEEVVIVGGDGSVQRSAREVAGESTVLVPAPGGTLNHFARRYGIDTLEGAAALVGRGRLQAVPLGVADDTLFLNTIILGAYPGILRTRERLEDAIGKWPAAGIGFARALARMPRVRVLLQTETRTMERATGMVWIGLGRGSWPLSHRIDRKVPEALLEIAVLRDVRRGAAAAWLLRLLRNPGAAGDDPAIERFHARSLVIRPLGDGGAAPPPSLEATLDGDPVSFPAPLFVSAVEGALRIRTGS